MKKICVVIGSRANYGSIKSVLHEIKKNKTILVKIKNLSFRLFVILQQYQIDMAMFIKKLKMMDLKLIK